MPTLHFGKVWQEIRHFGELYFAIQVPLKTVISNFITTRQIDTPYSSLCKYDHFNDDPSGQKIPGTKKSRAHKCINSFRACMLSHDRWLCLFLGGAAIWWCLRTGGGGILTSTISYVIYPGLECLTSTKLLVIHHQQVSETSGEPWRCSPPRIRLSRGKFQACHFFSHLSHFAFTCQCQACQGGDS